MPISIDEQAEILMQGTNYGDPRTGEVMLAELKIRLREAVKDGRPLRVYCGYDPRRPDLHLGHTITMRKLRQFQDFGHEVIFLIGTYTSLIGDPSDHSEGRSQLVMDEVQANAHTYAEQAFKILDRDKAQIRYNAEWLASLNFADLIRMASNFTIQQFLTRDNFRKRLEAGAAIYLHETFYSLMQAYDAVALKTDVQVGGADQLFNIVVAGRKLQEAMGQPPMIAIIMGESLPGTDGVIKMSKSLGNHIPLMTTPEDMYGKIMSVPDAAMRIYHKLLLGWGEAQLQQLDQEMESKPREVKMALARELVSTFHDQQSSTQAEEHFIRVFTEKAVPDDIPIVAVAEAVRLLDLLSAQQLVASKGEARRLIEQGGIRINGEQVVDLETLIDPTDGKEIIIKVGKRKFLKVTG